MTARSSYQWESGTCDATGGKPTASRTDQQLLEIFAQGGTAAIGILMSSYRGFLLHQCRRYSGGNADDAKDLFSLILFKVYTEHPEQLRKVRHLGAWLRRVAQNKSIDLQRERMAEERRCLGLMHLYESLGEIHPSPEEALLSQELIKHIQHSFDALPLRLQLAAHMRFVDDDSYETISNRLGISQVNARKRVQEARKRMTDALQRYVRVDGGERHKERIHAQLASVLSLRSQDTRHRRKNPGRGRVVTHRLDHRRRRRSLPGCASNHRPG
ncbi:MAG: sigma-70 family RNA polymerase sigma factor [Sulfurimicrobium sp.]|nr:sigma-70 family RNA polymerase sigma factor [Sulfurimicrobium sp.]MDP2199927.1 sigma-70 family RNA polymerase sigma factor [Sulfurimicrobium sp.]